MNDKSYNQAINDSPTAQLRAEAITVRIRWFGLCVGYVVVNLLSAGVNRWELNSILTLGAVYAGLDTLWSARKKVFLRQFPLFISLMEAVFIGMLCHFGGGVDSPFRFYYFLSLLVCAIRYSPGITYSTLALHAVSFATLAVRSGGTEGNLQPVILMLIFMAWVTWAGTALVALLTDVSRKQLEANSELIEYQVLLEQKIIQRTKQLQESQALIVHQEKQAAFGLLAAGIAHEVGNPLAAISGLVQLMDRRDLDTYMHDKLRLINEQLVRIQRTLRELIEFSRPGTTLQSVCHIHEVIGDALSIAKYYKRKKGKTVITLFAEGLPRVTLVRDHILQVMLNLILNSLDATEEGSCIWISTSLRQEQLHVTVRDQGKGIAIEDQQRLFAPYFTTKKTGTGLGLFVCRNLLTACGGAIDLVESSSSGTEFVVRISAEELEGAADIPVPDAPTSLDALPATASFSALQTGDKSP
ncbi:MAG: ATP-binding protein [Planctomycetaceae bacterium]